MSTQTTISQFFPSRKRQAAEDVKGGNQNNKVLILHKKVCDVSAPSSGDEIFNVKRVNQKDVTTKRLTPHHYNPKKTPKFSNIRQSVKKARTDSAQKSGTRKRLVFHSDDSLDAKPDHLSTPKRNDQPLLSLKENENVAESKSNTLKESNFITEQILITEPVEPKVVEQNPVPSTSHIDRATKTLDRCNSSSLRQELGLGEVRRKLIRSSRLNEIRNALDRINKGYEELAKLDSPPKVVPSSPSLKKFTSIEVEVPCSPVKSIKDVDVFMSPNKSLLKEAVFRSPSKPPTINSYVSPRKLFFEENKPQTDVKQVPAYERYSSLAAASGKPSLPLPYSYRLLGEIFRAVEVVSSMIHNRKETVTFSKLKKSSQELTKKTLSEHHLGQILTVFPDAFRLKYEKVKQQGYKAEKYDLTLLPITNEEGANKEYLAPSEQLQRRREFYKTLVNIVKSHHQKFLESLEPPIIVDSEKLTRWHPMFNLDSVPDIEPAPLPAPPQVDNFSSAKDLLNKAKDMFIASSRMEKALTKLSEIEANRPLGSQPSAASVVPGLTNALKGIPKSLLEKVRAKQAAKAAEILTRDPEKTKKKIEMGRLPEIARILRNLYVTQKKNVLERSFILDKLSSSASEILSGSKMDQHLSLLIETVPTWLTVTKYGHVDYIRMDKLKDMTEVLETIKKASDLIS